CTHNRAKASCARSSAASQSLTRARANRNTGVQQPAWTPAKRSSIDGSNVIPQYTPRGADSHTNGGGRAPSSAQRGPATETARSAAADRSVEAAPGRACRGSVQQGVPGQVDEVGRKVSIGRCRQVEPAGGDDLRDVALDPEAVDVSVPPLHEILSPVVAGSVDLVGVGEGRDHRLAVGVRAPGGILRIGILPGGSVPLLDDRYVLDELELPVRTGIDGVGRKDLGPEHLELVADALDGVGHDLRGQG